MIYVLVVAAPGILTLYLSLRTLINVLRYREASLGLFFSNLQEITFLIKLFAFSMFLFAATRFMDILDIFFRLPMNDTIVASILWCVNLVLVYIFYRIARMTEPHEQII